MVEKSTKDLMNPIINSIEDETTMSAGLRFLEGCALQLPDNLLQLKNSLLIEIMQQLNELGIKKRLSLNLKLFQQLIRGPHFTIKRCQSTTLLVENNLKP